MANFTSDAYLLHLVHRAERSRAELTRRKPMSAELRALEFWRAILGECCAAFVYVFLVCGAHVAWPLHSVNTLTKSFAQGFAMATAAHALGHISGAHANPALTLAMLVTRRITPLRALLYATAQCGGAVAGAALLYGVTSSLGRDPTLGCTLVDDSLTPWQAAALESVLTFVVGLTLFASADPDRKSTGSDALALGIAYLACALVALPATGASMNPARSLGPAFVMNMWTNHWVYWCGPAMGSVLAGLIYEFIFDSPRKVLVKDDPDKDATEVRDDSDSKSSSGLSVRPAQIHQAPPPCFRTPEGPRPHSRGPQIKYGQPMQTVTSYYSTVPRNSSGAGAYRTWSSEYGSSPQQQFKF